MHLHTILRSNSFLITPSSYTHTLNKGNTPRTRSLLKEQTKQCKYDANCACIYINHVIVFTSAPNSHIRTQERILQ